MGQSSRFLPRETWKEQTYFDANDALALLVIAAVEGGGDGEGRSDAHGAEGAGVEPMARQAIQQDRPADVHRVGALADDDRVGRNQLLHLRQHGEVVERRGPVGRHALSVPIKSAR